MNEPRGTPASSALIWSLWTELGVPGPRRSHAHTVIDPERLVAYTPWLTRSDARLSDLAFAWCEQHGRLLSGARMSTVLRACPGEVQRAAEPFLAELAASGVKLVRTRAPPSVRSRSKRDLPLPTERPSLLRLRVRGLVGIGGRADVLVALLSAPKRWVSARAVVDDVSFAKRQVARVLSELAEARIVHTRALANTHEFRLADPVSLGSLVQADPAASYPAWQHILEWTRLADALLRLPEDPPATYRVEVAKHARALRDLAPALGLTEPAPPPSAPPATIIAWATERAAALADGSAAAF